ncbi:MAG: hypothetical protein ACXVXP_00250 [Mycobacteriaceae bacterium]
MRVDDDLWEWLEKRAARDSLDRSAAIRALIEGYCCGEFILGPHVVK